MSDDHLPAPAVSQEAVRVTGSSEALRHAAAAGRPFADVSVVIPTYNRPALLREAVESVLAQTVAPREVIVVDNGTNNDSAVMLREFGDRVMYVRIPPEGVQAARNRGICEAGSAWVAMLDDDDLYQPTFLERILPALEDGRCDLVFTDHRKFVTSLRPGAQRTTNAQEAPQGYWDGVEPVKPGEHWCYVGSFPPERLLRYIGFYPSTMVIRKDLAARLGGYDPEVPGIEDIEFLTRAIVAGSLAFVTEPLVDYRLHGANTSGDLERQRVGRWQVFEYIAAKDLHGSPALAAALAVDLPRRRVKMLDQALRQVDTALLREVAPYLRPADWTVRRRMQRWGGPLLRVLRPAALRLARRRGVGGAVRWLSRQALGSG